MDLLLTAETQQRGTGFDSTPALLSDFDPSKLKKKPVPGSQAESAPASTEDKLRALQAKINKARQDAKKLTVEENKNTDSFTGQIRVRAVSENDEKKEAKTAEEKEELERRYRLSVTAGDVEKKYKPEKRKAAPDRTCFKLACWCGTNCAQCSATMLYTSRSRSAQRKPSSPRMSTTRS
jgi:hypothetical protein